MKLNEFYVAVDGNYEDAMERLQNEMFVGKFLRLLPRDSSMMLLEKAMADGQANDAFRAFAPASVEWVPQVSRWKPVRQPNGEQSM